jgi:hypothetical protein
LLKCSHRQTASFEMVLIVSQSPVPIIKATGSPVIPQRIEAELTALKSKMRPAFAIVSEKCTDSLGAIIGYDQLEKDNAASAKDRMNSDDLRAHILPVFCHFIQKGVDQIIADGTHSGVSGILKLESVYSAAFLSWVDVIPLFMDDPRIAEINKRFCRAMMTKELLAVPIEQIVGDGS